MESWLSETTYEDKQFYERALQTLSSKRLPSEYPKGIIKTLSNYLFRSNIISLSCFPIVSQPLIDELSIWLSNKRCLEIMSGRGVLTASLQKQYIDIFATDNYSWDAHSHWFDDTWCEVEKLDCISAIEKYGSSVDVVICSWPYMDNNAALSLKTLRKINPQAFFIYIGELEGGCTADDEFFEIVDFIEDEKFQNVKKVFQRWLGIYDDIYLCK